MIKNTLILVIISTLLSISAFSQKAWYVSAETGNNNNSGSKTSLPLKTIKKAIDNARYGDFIYLDNGTYREEVIFLDKAHGEYGAPITLTALSNAKPIIKGSDKVEGWEKFKYNIWVKKKWNHNSQQVFANGKILSQIGFSSDAYPATASDGNWMIRKVGNDYEDMVENSFYYDRNKKALYVWLNKGVDPNTQLIEASVRKNLLTASNSQYINIKGITFRHSNTSAFKQGGAAINMGSYCTIDDCDVQWCDFAAISPGNGTDVKIINCILNNNGDSGISTSNSSNFLIKNCKIMNNNYRLFNQDWHAGGIKVVTHSWGTIENCEIGNNQGVGVWFDWNFAGTGESFIKNCKIYNNARMGGIMIEASDRVSIIDNVIYNNDLFGIHYVISSYGTITGNTIIGQRGFIALDVSGPRSNNEHPLRDNIVMYNLIIDSECTFDIHVIKPDDKYVLNNVCDYNFYVRKGGPKLRYNEGGRKEWKDILVTGDIEEWYNTSGFGEHSVVIDPNKFENITIRTE